MVVPLVLATVAFLHIVFAIAWLGGALYFAFVLGPRSRSLSPVAAMEFIAKVGRTTTTYVLTVSTLTIIFGLALLYVYFGGDYAKWPLTMEIGFTLGLIAYLEGMLSTGPTMRKASGIANGYVKNPQQGAPPAELLALMKKGGISSTIGTVILVFAAAFMVSTAFY